MISGRRSMHATGVRDDRLGRTHPLPPTASMSERTDFLGEPDDTREQIMHATYRVLAGSGYAGLSLGKIASESGLSKSSVYHFYDDKEDLLVAFVEYMLEHFQREFAVAEDRDPTEQLRTFLAVAVGAPVPSGRPESAPPEFGEFVELRAQAVNNEAYRETFSRHDRVMSAELASIVRRGIDAGEFRDIDPDRFAEWFLTFLSGAIFRSTTSYAVEPESLMETAEEVLRDILLVEDAR